MQAVEAFVVVWAWGQLMIAGEKWFDNTPDGTAMLVVPLIFMIVAVLSALAVLGYPLYYAFHEKNWPKAMQLLGWTLAWLLVIAVILILVFIK